MIDKLLERLAELIVAKLVDHTDEIAAAIAHEVLLEVGPKLPDLSNLDDLLVAKLPDLNTLSGQIVNQILSRIPFLGGR